MESSKEARAARLVAALTESAALIRVLEAEDGLPAPLAKEMDKQIDQWTTVIIGRYNGYEAFILPLVRRLTALLPQEVSPGTPLAPQGKQEHERHDHGR